MNNESLIGHLGYTGALLTKLGADNRCIDASNLIRDITTVLSGKEWSEQSCQDIADLLELKGIKVLDYPPVNAHDGEDLVQALHSLGYDLTSPISADFARKLVEQHLGFEPDQNQVNDMTDEVNGPQDILEYEVCTNCLLFVANGEDNGGEDEDWDAQEVADRMTAEKNGRQGYWVTGVRPTNDDPEGHGRVEFTHHGCELCGDQLAGERHGITLHFDNTNPLNSEPQEQA